MTDQTPHFPLSAWAPKAFADLQQELEGLLPPFLQPIWEKHSQDLPGHELYPIRPYLLLLAARHYGSPEGETIKLAASIHMIYIASNLHDRLGACLDGKAAYPVNEEDSGQSPQALDILLGDFLFSMASDLIVSVGNHSAIKDTIETSGASAENQAMLVTLDNQTDGLKADECLNVAVNKVALLFGLSLRLGACLGQASEKEKKAFSDFGKLLGRAHKIVQDVHFWQDSPCPTLYIPPERKFSHPLIRLWEEQGQHAWQETMAQLEPATDEAWSGLKERLASEGYLKASITAAQELAEQAEERLKAIKDSEELKILKNIASLDFIRGWQ